MAKTAKGESAKNNKDATGGTVAPPWSRAHSKAFSQLIGDAFLCEQGIPYLFEASEPPTTAGWDAICQECIEAQYKAPVAAPVGTLEELDKLCERIQLRFAILHTWNGYVARAPDGMAAEFRIGTFDPDLIMRAVWDLLHQISGKEPRPTWPTAEMTVADATEALYRVSEWCKISAAASEEGRTKQSENRRTNTTRVRDMKLSEAFDKYEAETGRSMAQFWRDCKDPSAKMLDEDSFRRAINRGKAARQKSAEQEDS